MAKKAPPVKILTDAQLKTAQRLLTKVADDMNRKAVSIENYRPANGNKTIKPGEFKKMLTKICTPTTMQELTNAEIGNLIHYLV